MENKEQTSYNYRRNEGGREAQREREREREREGGGREIFCRD